MPAFVGLTHGGERGVIAMPGVRRVEIRLAPVGELRRAVEKRGTVRRLDREEIRLGRGGEGAVAGDAQGLARLDVLRGVGGLGGAHLADEAVDQKRESGQAQDVGGAEVEVEDQLWRAGGLTQKDERPPALPEQRLVALAE